MEAQGIQEYLREQTLEGLGLQRWKRKLILVISVLMLLTRLDQALVDPRQLWSFEVALVLSSYHSPPLS